MDAKFCETIRYAAPMTEPAAQTSPFGDLVESKRSSMSISIREAARRAGISEGRWRQVVKGRVASDRVVVAMALTVGVDPHEALAVAGIEMDAEDLAAMIEAFGKRGPLDVLNILPRKAAGNGTSKTGRLSEARLVAEIERIDRMSVSEETKARLRKIAYDSYERAAAKRNAG